MSGEIGKRARGARSTKRGIQSLGIHRMAAGGQTKYHSKKIRVHGITFDSKAEAARYCLLKNYADTGQIQDLEVHPRYILKLNGVKLTTFIPDFRYRRAGELVVEDVKGYLNRRDPNVRLFILKARLLRELEGIEVKVMQEQRMRRMEGWRVVDDVF